MHQCIYLHGFASGPVSTKARFLSSRLRELELTVHVPDLNGNSFSELTISNQLSIVRRVIEANTGGSPLFLVGSSMGGLLATMIAAECEQVAALILLAPGFGLNRRWHELLSPEQFNSWRDRGSIEVYNYVADRNLPLNYSFIEDAQTHQTDSLRVSVPTLVIHGQRDEVVPITESKSFVSNNPSIAELCVMNSDHNLIDVLPDIWDLIHKFLQKQDIIA